MKKFIFFLLLLSVSSTCLAEQVELASTKPLKIPVDNVTPRITSEDIAKVIPLDMTEGSSQSTVISRVVDRGVSLWMRSSTFKNSSLGRMAEETQEKLKTDIEVPATSEEGISHKFSVKVEAFQAMARLEYTGWVKAMINFDAKDSSTDIIFEEDVFENKKMIVSHKADREQALSMVGLAWSW